MGWKVEDLTLPYENDWGDDCKIVVSGSSVSDTVSLVDNLGNSVTLYIDQLHELYNHLLSINAL